MRPIDALIRFDDWILSGVQAAYDGLLDLFGLYVGTCRAAAASVAVGWGALTILANGFRPGHDATLGLFLATGYTVYVGGLIWTLFVRDHLGRDWLDQDAGRFVALNARTLRLRSGVGLLWRGVIFGFSVCQASIDLALWPLIGQIVLFMFYVTWTYFVEVQVRARRDVAATVSIDQRFA